MEVIFICQSSNKIEVLQYNVTINATSEEEGSLLGCQITAPISAVQRAEAKLRGENSAPVVVLWHDTCKDTKKTEKSGR